MAGDFDREGLREEAEALTAPPEAPRNLHRLDLLLEAVEAYCDPKYPPSASYLAVVEMNQDASQRLRDAWRAWVGGGL